MNQEALEGASFRKARGCADKNCVEVAAVDHVIGVRDSKNGKHGPVLAFTPEKWAVFVNGAKNGEFDLS